MSRTAGDILYGKLIPYMYVVCHASSGVSSVSGCVEGNYETCPEQASMAT